MRYLISIAITCLAAALSVSVSAEVRTWTDNTGKHKTEAEFVSFDDETVTLRKANGKLAKLKLSQLSKDDQDHVAALTNKSDSSSADAKTDETLSRPQQRGGLVNSVRSAPLRAESLNKLKQICTGLINYESTHGRFPTAAAKTATGSGLSWRVAILPFLEEDSLYRRFRMNEPWDSPHNKKLITSMPSIYMSPGGSEERGWTNYLAVASDRSIIVDGAKGVRASDVTDGLSKTVMVVEADDTVAAIWTKPEDYPWHPDKPTAGLGGIWPGYFLAGFGDGSTRRITLDSAEQISAFLTRNGRESVTLEE